MPFRPDPCRPDPSLTERAHVPRVREPGRWQHLRRLINRWRR